MEMDVQFAKMRMCFLLGIVAICILLSSCTGTTGEINTACDSSSPVSATYTITSDWIPPDSSMDLVAYKIYYSLGPALTKVNNLGTVQFHPEVNFILDPSVYNLKKCALAYFSLTAITRFNGESEFSEIKTILIE